MTYPSIKETFYRADDPRTVILIVPHGADAAEFLLFFPEIKAHPELAKVWPIFEAYLEIERDVGATELAHAIAYELVLTHGVNAQVVELNYPRGLLDGGRLKGHALRRCLPNDLMEQLEANFLAIHDSTLVYMDRVYETMQSHGQRQSLLVDVHTMASFCPVDESGHKFTFPVSFPRLEAYVNQYLEARNHLYQRKIDLISADDQGKLLADERLLQSLKKALQGHSYPCLENEPYHAAPVYLSFQHMQMVPSISIDVPKHHVASADEQGFELDRIAIDAPSIRHLAKILALGVAKAF